MKTLQDFPAYQVADQKLTEVKAKHRAAIEEREELLSLIEGARDRTESLSDQAQRLLSGDDATIADIGSLRERYARACRQVNLLAEVVRLARHRVEDERATASREICEAARPEFSKLVEAELRAGKDLLEAQDRRREYWQALRDDGVSMATLPQTAPLVKGFLGDPQHTLWERVRDAERQGYVEAGEFAPPVPKPERMGVGKHFAAGPGGSREVLVDAAGKVTPGNWIHRPKAAA